MSELADTEREYKRLLLAILRKGMDDYVKLQHPRYRKKKYLQDAFESSIAMFFDDSYRFLHLKNEDGEEMSLADLLSWFITEKNMDIETLRTHLIQDAKVFWENKLLNAIDIPDSFIYDGHAYSIIHSEVSGDYDIDYEAKEIFLNQDSDNSDNQEIFVHAATEVMLYHEDIRLPKKEIPQLGKAFYKMIRVNSCFIES